MRHLRSSSSNWLGQQVVALHASYFALLDSYCWPICCAWFSICALLPLHSCLPCWLCPALA
jgi:hypothetical protein